MIIAAAGIVIGLLMALDVGRNLRTGVASTVFGTYSRTERPGAFRAVWIGKLVLAALVFFLSFTLLMQESA